MCLNSGRHSEYPGSLSLPYLVLIQQIVRF